MDRTCKWEGCTLSLRPSNKSGLCYHHSALQRVWRYKNPGRERPLRNLAPARARKEGFKSYFDPGPLKQYVAAILREGNLEHLGPYGYLRRHSLDARILYRRSIRWDTVDRVCCALGVHPLEVYPDWLEEAA